MKDRYRKLTRRRFRSVYLLLGAAVVAASLTAAVFAAFLGDAGLVDVQVQNRNNSVVDEQTDGGAFISYFGDSDNTFGSSGTGTFEPFVRLQASPNEQGYNTDGAVQFDTKTGTWTHAIKVSEIPQRPCPDENQNPPPAVGSLTCFELFVDINEINSDKQVALNKVEVWFTDNPNLTGYPFTPSATTTPEYSFNGDILINDVNQGSGRGDLRYDIPINGPQEITLPPNCNYGNTLCETYFVLYSQWGTGPSPTSTWDSSGGFEEWKVRIYPTPPDVSVAKTPDGGTIGAGSNAVFTMTITNNGPIDATNVTLSDALPTANGLDWSITSQGLGPGFTGGTSCTLSAADVLSCTIATLANGASYRIVVSSATTAANCGTIPNTVTISATGDVTPANNTDTGSIVVSCGAIRILKNSTKGGAVANAGAVFSITGAGITGSLSVTDAATAGTPPADEDADIGEVCVSGLQPGQIYTVNETSPPTGYGDATQTDVTVTAVAGGCSSAGLGSATFSNAPLGSVVVKYNDGGSGETVAKIDCDEGTQNPADGTPGGFDDTDETYTNIPAGTTATPNVVNCTISIDP